MKFIVGIATALLATGALAQGTATMPPASNTTSTTMGADQTGGPGGPAASTDQSGGNSAAPMATTQNGSRAIATTTRATSHRKTCSSRKRGCRR